MSTTAPKNARVDFRIAAEQKEMLEKAAALKGLNLSDFLVSTSLTAASEILERQTKIALTERDWEQFLELLGTETEATEAAKKAAARYNEGTVEGHTYRW